MELSAKPDARLAEKVLPGTLREALVHIFSQGISGCTLVGGAALAGYYAGHRRSDELDLFTQDMAAQKAAVLAVRSLHTIGVEMEELQNNAQYFRANCKYKGHSFTVDAVEDANLFRVGEFITLSDGITVADLETLLMTKTATLVSRCAEKDLYDLIWIFDHVEGLRLEQVVNWGKEIDGGLSGEALLMSLAGARLREEACDFSLSPGKSRKMVFDELVAFQKTFARNLARYLRSQPVPDLVELARATRRVKRLRR